MSFKKRIIKELLIVKLHWWKILIVSFHNFYILFAPLKNISLYFNDMNYDTQIIDYSHRLIPEYHGKNIQDIPQTLLWIITVILMLSIPMFHKSCHEKGIYAIKSFIASLYICGLMYTLRAICITVTIMPSPNPLCRNKSLDKPHTVQGNLILNNCYIC